MTTQRERRMQDALEVRIAHAQLAHLSKRVPDVIHAMAALADALRDQPGAPMQVELLDVGRMRGVGQKGEGAHLSAGRQ